MNDRAIDVLAQFLLPFSVLEGKRQSLDGRGPVRLPLRGERRPFAVLEDETVEPVADLVPGIFFEIIADLLGVQVAIGHADADAGIIFRFPRQDHIRVALRLRQMHALRRLHVLQAAVGRLDLINDWIWGTVSVTEEFGLDALRQVLFREPALPGDAAFVDAVRAALDDDGSRLVQGAADLQRHLGAVSFSLRLLELAVHP